MLSSWFLPKHFEEVLYAYHELILNFLLTSQPIAIWFLPANTFIEIAVAREIGSFYISKSNEHFLSWFSA
jgi:hypothetical protein